MSGKQKKTPCPDCGALKSRYAQYCKPCSAKGERNSRFGQTQSAETRAKISARATGRPHPERLGENHPMWKGDNASKQSGRARALSLFPMSQSCKVCGVEKTERHHVDGNTLNNSDDNVMFLCRPHHRQIHPGHGKVKLRSPEALFVPAQTESVPS